MGTDMCVTFPYLGSEGSRVKKSMFRGSTFLHPALDSIVVRIVKRLLSFSKANN